MIGKNLRNFRIVSEIGEGGMGVVYLAEHIELPKRFAIKSLSKALSGDPNFRKRFYEEAQKQALLDDPNIVQVTDFFEEEGQFFLVMEYVDGQDLSHVIKSRGKLPQSEVLAIFRDILKGLGFAHAKGLVHRDMKPSNVLIDKSGRARIMDFGIAILAGAGEKRLTAAGAAIGSPWYMSPEQIERPHELDQRTDIYALGIVLYEMLTGEVPFDGETDFSVHYQQIKTPAPDPRQKNSEISEELAQIVLKAMAKNPAERFQNCSEFLQAIEAVEKGKKGPTKAVIGALLAMILASVGTIVYLYTRPPDITIVETGIGNEQLIEVERKAAYNLIQSGSEKAWFTCTQFKQLKLKERGSQTAKLIGDTNLEEQIKKQIQDHRKNIDNALTEYSGFLVQLADAKYEIVTQQFDEYTRVLGQKESFDQIQIARLMKRHYERHREGNKSVNAGMMDADCEGVFGKGT
ncbi:MAG TPA: protein kinase [Candidatus Binatia bacterium]|jgi:serine/threonine protein kinase